MTLPLLIGSFAWAGVAGSASLSNAAAEDTIVAAAPDTFMTAVVGDTVRMHELVQRPITAKIYAMGRCYGDSIVLRWSGEDYVTQRHLHTYGLNIYRHDMGTGDMDTVAFQFRPLTLDEFRAKYNPTDSMAYAAMGALYSQASLKPDQTRNEPGSVGSWMEIQDDQQTRLMMMQLVADWRGDLANDMAVRIVDKNVERGHIYKYILQPSDLDESRLAISPAQVSYLENKDYVPEDFNPLIGDSIVGPLTVQLTWENMHYSTYEIYRRKYGELEWTHINERPYMQMNAAREQDDLVNCFIQDNVPEPGIYEYRVRAHDTFGSLTRPSGIHKVSVKDNVPPTAPQLTHIEIERMDSENLMNDIYATLYFEKDTLEEDLMGYMPMYYHEQFFGKEWHPLTDSIVSPDVLQMRVNVTGLTTGMVAVVAVDNSGNQTFSLPQVIRITDLKAPDAPTNLKAVTNNENGTITLTWDQGENDIDYYEIAFANDTTHRFMLKSREKVKEKMFVDTVATDVNQKYIYYKVRAIDYSTNEGDYSDVLQVVRPSTLPPTEGHLESSSVEDDGIHMRWAMSNDQQMSHHHLVRRLENEQQWTVVARWDADSVNAVGGMVDVVDRPEYNRLHRYVYAVESFAVNGLCTFSVELSMAWQGANIFDWPIKLYGEYDKQEKATRLVWEVDDKLPYKGQWYFTIYQKLPTEDRFKFLISADPKYRDHTNYLLQPGEQAEYYVQIQYKDGRKSSPSNTVTVAAPAAQ